jgi:hypothetical protein
MTLHNTDFALQMKIGGFALFLHDISKYAFSFCLSRTDHLGTETSCLLNFLMQCVIYDRLKFVHFEVCS